MLLKDYESSIARAATPEAVWAILSDYFRHTVVDRVVYLHLPPIGAPDSRKPRLVVLGARTEAQLARNLGAAELKLTAEDRSQLDKVSLPRLLYPHWHQARTIADRLGSGEASLLRGHLEEWA